jgi:hypothetical protein
MLHYKRRNIAWLTILGSMVGIAVLSATVSANVQVALLGILAVAVVGSLFEFGQQQAFMNALQRARHMQTRVSPQAKEATERARRRGSYIDESTPLVDIGLIATQSGYEGTVMRRARSVSRDDNGVRPFITLNVAPEASDQRVLVRFEILDHEGQEQYIHEMRTYLHDGEMNVLATHHLPLMDNDSIPREGDWGDWDLRVYIDNRLIAMHNFTLGPSVYERHRRPESGELERRRRLEAQDEALPTSLEDLLRSQSGQQGESRN